MSLLRKEGLTENGAARCSVKQEVSEDCPEHEASVVLKPHFAAGASRWTSPSTTLLIQYWFHVSQEKSSGGYHQALTCKTFCEFQGSRRWELKFLWRDGCQGFGPTADTNHGDRRRAQGSTRRKTCEHRREFGDPTDTRRWSNKTEARNVDLTPAVLHLFLRQAFSSKATRSFFSLSQFRSQTRFDPLESFSHQIPTTPENPCLAGLPFWKTH